MTFRPLVCTRHSGRVRVKPLDIFNGGLSILTCARLGAFPCLYADPEAPLPFGRAECSTCRPKRTVRNEATLKRAQALKRRNENP